MRLPVPDTSPAAPSSPQPHRTPRPADIPVAAVMTADHAARAGQACQDLLAAGHHGRGRRPLRNRPTDPLPAPRTARRDRRTPPAPPRTAHPHRDHSPDRPAPRRHRSPRRPRPPPRRTTPPQHPPLTAAAAPLDPADLLLAG